MLRKKQTARVLSARRVTDLKSFPLVSPRDYAKGRKNFDVYLRDKKKPILSARRNKAPPFSRPLSICVRTGARFCFTTEAGKEQCGLVLGRYARISSNSEGESGIRGILKDRGWSAYASLSPETHTRRKHRWKHRAVRNRVVDRKVFGDITLPKSQTRKTREEDIKIRTILLTVILLYFYGTLEIVEHFISYTM